MYHDCAINTQSCSLADPNLSNLSNYITRLHRLIKLVGLLAVTGCMRGRGLIPEVWRFYADDTNHLLGPTSLIIALTLIFYDSIM